MIKRLKLKFWNWFFKKLTIEIYSRNCGRVFYVDGFHLRQANILKNGFIQTESMEIQLKEELSLFLYFRTK